MKAAKALEILGISRRTLSTYVKKHKIKCVRLDNGFYEYDDESVKLLACEISHKSKVIIDFHGKRMIFNLLDDQLKLVLEYCCSLAKV